ncbi:MAG: protein kinase, partial [Acidobacteriota bacterium]
MTDSGLPPTVARYAIERKIAEGGFGDIYLATDTELHRAVAIKSVRLEPGAPETLQARFRREAEVLARIDHPFICKVYETLEVEGRTLLVMEYVEGRTLASLLREGPLGLRRTLKVARELSEALGFAHQAGVIHRDIKPANVIITHNDHVKVVDFGLAKRVEPVTEDASTELTERGNLLGTVQYMSPEQATGAELDGRTDVFSFGVILYQCLTGRLPFAGKDRSEYFFNLLNGRREDLPGDIPGRMRDVVDGCLRSDPEDRIRSFDEILRWLRDGTGIDPKPLPWRELARRWGWAAGPALVLGALIAWALLSREAPPDMPTFAGSVQTAFITSPYDERDPRLSPDGGTVVYVSNRGGGERLWLKATAGGDAQPITDEAVGLKTPTWSSRGDEIAYLSMEGSETQLLRVTPFGAESAPAVWLQHHVSDVSIVRWSGPYVYLLIYGGSAG